MLTEKAAYLKGLMEGLEIDGSTKEGKVLLALRDVIDEICETVDAIDSDVDDVVDFCERMDEDLCDVEEAVFGDDDDEDGCCCGDEDCCCRHGDDDDCEYEVVCPTCGDTIELTEPMLEDGSVECPNCGELLEFDLEDDEENSEDEE